MWELARLIWKTWEGKPNYVEALEIACQINRDVDNELMDYPDEHDEDDLSFDHPMSNIPHLVPTN